MVKISAEIFSKNYIHTITYLRKGKKLALWIRIKDIGKELDVENIYDLINKEVKGNLKLITLQMNKLVGTKDMGQN